VTGTYTFGADGVIRERLLQPAHSQPQQPVHSASQFDTKLLTWPYTVASW
jgi:hypothetical protein